MGDDRPRQPLAEQSVGNEIAELRGEVAESKGEFSLQLARLARTMVFAFVSVSVAMLGAMTAIVYTAPA